MNSIQSFFKKSWFVAWMGEATLFNPFLSTSILLYSSTSSSWAAATSLSCMSPYPRACWSYSWLPFSAKSQREVCCTTNCCVVAPESTISTSDMQTSGATPTGPTRLQSGPWTEKKISSPVPSCWRAMYTSLPALGACTIFFYLYSSTTHPPH